MVAQVTLDHSVWVRVLVPEPNGAMVKRLRRRPLKAKSRVRFPLALPEVNAEIQLNFSVFIIYNYFYIQGVKKLLHESVRTPTSVMNESMKASRISWLIAE